MFKTLLVSATMLLGLACAARAQQDQSRSTTDQAAADLAAYRQHVETLANPFMEGRGPGLKGNRIAAEYFEWNFKRLKLEPAFPAVEPEPATVAPKPHSYMQEFTAGREVRGDKSLVSYTPLAGANPVELLADSDFIVLGNSGSASVEGEVVFVGYSLPPGEPATGGLKPSDASYIKSDDLKGKIALILRFEPMTDEGTSRLTENGAWSSAAAISQKINAAVERGAAAVIVVSPPGANDPRAGKLETTAGTANWTRPLDVPAIMLSTDAADRFVRAADAAGRSLLELRRVADKAQSEGGAGGGAGGGTGGGGDEHSRLIPLGKASLSIRASVERLPRITWNVGGILPGRGDLASQYIIIGGHYDHVGYGYTGGSRTSEYGQIHPGADDNASGAAGVLVAARILSREYAAAEGAGDHSPRRSILFLGFSAEEMGLIGSREFVKNSPISSSAVYTMLNMDMIGRMRNHTLELSGTGTAKGFADLIKPILDSSGFNVKSSPGGQGPSDHATFYGANIPVLHFFTGLHDQYHTPRDTADLINHDEAIGVVRTVCEVGRLLAARAEPLIFTPTDRSRTRERPEAERPNEDAPPTPAPARVRLGVRPANYADGEDGVAVDDVYDGTAAAEAGIIAGDRLMAWNGQPMPDAQAMTDFMRSSKPGDVVDITLMRKGERVTARVTLKARDQAAK